MTLITEIGHAANAGEPGDHAQRCDLRCVCGSLVAKVFDDFVELKCRRCKRTMRIPVQRGP